MREVHPVDKDLQWAQPTTSSIIVPTHYGTSLAKGGKWGAVTVVITFLMLCIADLLVARFPWMERGLAYLVAGGTGGVVCIVKAIRNATKTHYIY